MRKSPVLSIVALILLGGAFGVNISSVNASSIDEFKGYHTFNAIDNFESANTSDWKNPSVKKNWNLKGDCKFIRAKNDKARYIIGFGDNAAFLCGKKNDTTKIVAVAKEVASYLWDRKRNGVTFWEWLSKRAKSAARGVLLDQYLELLKQYINRVDLAKKHWQQVYDIAAGGLLPDSEFVHQNGYLKSVYWKKAYEEMQFPDVWNESLREKNEAAFIRLNACYLLSPSTSYMKKCLDQFARDAVAQ